MEKISFRIGKTYEYSPLLKLRHARRCVSFIRENLFLVLAWVRRGSVGGKGGLNHGYVPGNDLVPLLQLPAQVLHLCPHAGHHRLLLLLLLLLPLLVHLLPLPAQVVPGSPHRRHFIPAEGFLETSVVMGIF